MIIPIFHHEARICAHNDIFLAVVAVTQQSPTVNKVNGSSQSVSQSVRPTDRRRARSRARLAETKGKATCWRRALCVALRRRQRERQKSCPTERAMTATTMNGQDPIKVASEGDKFVVVVVVVLVRLFGLRWLWLWLWRPLVVVAAAGRAGQPVYTTSGRQNLNHTDTLTCRKFNVGLCHDWRKPSCRYSHRRDLNLSSDIVACAGPGRPSGGGKATMVVAVAVELAEQSQYINSGKPGCSAE